MGSDVAGSVRLPAAWSGVYALRCTTGRWPKAGVNTSMAGQEGVPSVFSPMARTLNDLAYFTKSIIGMQPWKYDHSVHPITWRDDQENGAKGRKLRIGLMTSDGILSLRRVRDNANETGVVPPTPAIDRALSTTVAALTAAGHTIAEITPPETATPFACFNLASQLLNSDGCKTFNSHRHTGEPSDTGAAQLTRIASLPRFIRYLYYLYVRYIRGDSKWATLIRSFSPKSSAEQWTLVAKREAARATWHNWWNTAPQEYDFILCPANATPALPHNSMRGAVSSCGYTFLWNFLDYTAGVIPVSRVDPKQDALGVPYKKALKALGADSAISRGAWMHYDAAKMQGLPTAVQIVGRRWEEEKILGFMRVVEDALEGFTDPQTGLGGKYKVVELD